MKFTKSLLFLSVCVFFSFTLLEKDKIVIYLVGDSTMADKEVKAYPETGWGTPFKIFFDSSVVVENHAKNGRSTRTFMTEGRWQTIVDKLEEGDYVFIQFGHNDEVQTKKSSTTPDEYQANLEKYITDTRSKNATPILLTPITRRQFDENNHVKETHPEYSDLLTEIGKKMNVPVIDMDTKSRKLVEGYGPDFSKELYLHLKPEEHPNYPDGVEDNTHFSELGARKMAQMVLAEIREIQPGLAERIVKKD